MSIRLSRKKINDMVDRGYSFSSSRSGGGSGAGGGGGVSSTWVDEHYVSKEFFARLFTINGTDENDDPIVVEPNDLETTITNIKMMVGAWTEQYLSALGLSDGGSGGGGAIALQDLVNVEYVGTPSGGQILKYNDTTGKWYNADDGGGSGDYLPLTGGTLTGNLSVKGTHDLSLANNGISQISYLGYYIKDTNNKRSAQYINTVSANGNNSFWMSVTYNVSGSTELDKGFGLTVDKQGNCSWHVDGAPEFRSAIGINLDNLVTTNTEQTISAAKLFSGGITPIAAGSVQTVSAGSKIWFKRASATTDNTPNNGIVLEYGGSNRWVGQLFMADNGRDGLYWGGWFDSTRQSWMKILDELTGVTLTTTQTITGAKTFTSDVLHANNTTINFNNTSDTACSVLTLNSSNNIVIGWGVRSVSDTYIMGRTISLNVGGNTSVFYATNGGNVGIGTTNPGTKLDVSGQLRATTYLSCHNAVGENGTAGWVCFAIVTVSSAWATQPLKFKVSQRGRLGGEITLRFAGVDAASKTTVQEFSYTGNIRAARVVRNGANFSLYIQKHEEYDDIAISLVNLGTYMSSKLTVTWTNSLSSSDPGGTAATCRYYFSNTAYMEWDETNSAVHFVNAGVYSDTFVSSLGANSSGGGGGVNLNTLLTSLNSTSLNPATVSNKVLVNSSGTWTWQEYIAGGGGGGSVTSVGLSMPTGFSITGTNPITESGTFTVTANGTMVPNLNADKLDGYEASGLFETLKNSTASGHTYDIEIKIGNTTKYLTVGYATSAGSATTSGSSDIASALSTVSKTLWGNTYWTSGGVPTSVGTSNSIASLSYVGNISMSGSITGCTDIDSILNFDTTNSRVGVGASSPSTRLHVKGRITAEYDSTYSGSFQAIRGNYVTLFGINSSGYAFIATAQNGSSSATVRLSFTPYTETTDPHILTGTSSLKIGTYGTTFYDGKYMQIGAVRMVYNASNTLKVIKADNTTANLEVSGRAIVNSIDLMGENDSGTYYSYLDFHYNGSTADYTTRLIETSNAELSIRSNSGSTKTGLVVGRAVDGDYVKIGDIYIGYDSANDALEVYKISGNSHASANLYARGAVSALGQGGSGSGGGIDLNTMWNALENSASTHSIGTNASRLSNIYATNGKITSINANEIGVGGFASGYQFSVIGDSSLTGFVEANGNFYVRDYAAINTAVDQNYRLKVSGSSLFDGRVGIGGINSDTATKLYVSGKSIFTGAFYAATDFQIRKVINPDDTYYYSIGVNQKTIDAQGTWNGTFNSGSDIRQKDVIGYREISLDDIAGTPIFEFTWKDKRDTKIHLGTSAQYWDDILPSVVYGQKENKLSMDYGATALAAAVMTARKVVDHEARIKRMEKEIELLKAMQS